MKNAITTQSIELARSKRNNRLWKSIAVAAGSAALFASGCGETQKPVGSSDSIPVHPSYSGAQPTGVESEPTEAPEESQLVDTETAGAVKKAIEFTQAGADEIVPVPTEVVDFGPSGATVEVGLPGGTAEDSWCIHLAQIGDEWEVGEVEANDC